MMIGLMSLTANAQSNAQTNTSIDWNSIAKEAIAATDIALASQIKNLTSDDEYCIDAYQQIVSNTIYLKSLTENESAKQEVKLRFEIQANTLKTVDLTCDYLLGERKTRKIKKTIFNE